MQPERTPIVYLSEKEDPIVSTAFRQLGEPYEIFILNDSRKVSQLSPDFSHFILLVDELNLRKLKSKILTSVSRNYLNQVYIIVLGDQAFDLLNTDHQPHALPQWNVLNYPLKLEQVKLALINARQHLLDKLEVERLKQTLHSQGQELYELYNIGIGLSAERNPDILLETILKKGREITHADAGSLYLVETKDDVPEQENNYFANKQLVFKLAHNDSVKISFKESVMPIEKKSVAGYVALTGESVNIPDVYDLAADSKFGHNRSFDESIGYRAKSMLVIPLKTHLDEIIGVLQLINRKKHWDARLVSPAIIEQEVIPFDEKCVDLACSLASQAAISIENTRLYDEIKKLFEGFIRASVHAIEQRDPTTFGHSERVATLTTALAQKVDSVDSGKFKYIKFTHQQLQQINYAALLHDFGKIGVRENVLVKAKKLFPHELDAVKSRFKIFKQATELKYSNEKITCLLQEEKERAMALFSAWDHETRRQIQELDQYLRLILEINEPTVIQKTAFEMLQRIGAMVFEVTGSSEKLLTSSELEALSIPKGSLSHTERLEIESHVTHTFNFLSKIPWTSELKRLPQIAYAHHEKLDGSGYPQGLDSSQIPIESKMMTIADIYDALTAWDRPYKKAVPIDKALQIIQWEVNDGKIDADLFQIFMDARLYELVKKSENI